MIEMEDGQKGSKIRKWGIKQKEDVVKRWRKSEELNAWKLKMLVM